MKTLRILVIILLTVFVCGAGMVAIVTCSSSDDDDDNDDNNNEPILWYDFAAHAPWYTCPTEEIPAEATIVTAFDQDWHWFGSENNREITREITFPENDQWSQIGLWLQLECPESGNCDHWDRAGSVQLVTNPEAAREDWQFVELVRHITPYRLPMCQYVDVTHLATLLKGPRTLWSWIDTWVGPGSSSGEGWLITVRFIFYPGPKGYAETVANVWGMRTITLGNIDPDNNVDSQIDPVTVAIPAGTQSVVARLITTGHAFNNTSNCAEFCQMRQDLYVNGALFSVNPWRSDCEENPVSNQFGTWKYDRNGWCPGSIVVGNRIDITGAITPGSEAVFDFDIRLANGEEYNNTNPGEYAAYELISLQLFLDR